MPPEDINRHTYKVMFPEEALVLQQEIINHHPKLLEELDAMGVGATLQEKIAVVVTYCELLVDGYFPDDDMKKLFVLLIKKLKDKSAPHWKLVQP